MTPLDDILDIFGAQSLDDLVLQCTDDPSLRDAVYGFLIDRQEMDDTAHMTNQLYVICEWANARSQR